MEEEWKEIALYWLKVDIIDWKLFSFQGNNFRYLISDFEGGSLLRIEPVRKKRDEGEVECVAENAHGDPVSAKAALTIFDGKILIFNSNTVFHILSLIQIVCYNLFYWRWSNLNWKKGRDI